MNQANQWKYTLKIKDLLHHDISDGDIQSKAKPIATSIANRLESLGKNYPELAEGYMLGEFMEALKSIHTVERWKELCAEDPEWEDEPPAYWLDGLLIELYSWCDSNRVWVN